MRFLGQPIEVRTEAKRLVPSAFRWKGEWQRIVEIRREWFDTGHGATPVRLRNWRTRRHRKHFLVRTEKAGVFHLYYDYSNRTRPVWILAKALAEAPAAENERRGGE